jgi:SAM-dependent methyltransferase
MKEFSTTQKEQESAPYDQVAIIYDRMMYHVNYKHWSKYIRNLFFYYPGKVKSIYDLSCGTGRLLPYLKNKKCSIYGSDLSLPMLKMARKNTGKYNISLWCADARQLPLKKDRFHMALMLYDSMNYIMEETGVVSLLGNVADGLKDNGLFLFDVVTIKGCRDHFNKYYESDSYENIYYVRRSWYGQREGIQYNHFFITRNGINYTELHRQKIRTVKEWEELIENSPFEIINFYDNFSYRPVHKNSERIHILCRKKS